MENFASTECLSPGDVKNRKQAGENIQVIDVRSPEEFGEKHVPGAVNLPLDGLGKATSRLDRSAVLVTACGKGGGRSATGAETLRKLGFRAVWLCGGTFGWFDEN
ncbi:MAG: rhodanese-like domain-containing protein [Bacteroidetes bacterium]|nr:rhodanese-like domain-containing protein [Bacteroidota bacterium]